MQNRERIKYLLHQHIAKTASMEERHELFEALKDQKDTQEWEQLLRQMAANSETDALYDRNRWEPMIDKILHSAGETGIKKPTKVRTMITWPRVAAAAVILLLIGAASYFWINHMTKTELAKIHSLQIINDIAPGSNKAILTLSNGQKIILDSAAKGIITQQGNTKIIKLDSGQLAYNSLDEKPGEVLYNTITTPRGGQYEIVLADGSKVWLNAASSLKYPTSFSGEDRRVVLTGEGYFEVAKNTKMPFRVAVADIQVTVLGTHFNINAYADEPMIKTTLLEGSVNVKDKMSNVKLNPGQQAIATANGQLAVNNNADVDEVMAWKNGLFSLDKTDIQTFMRMVSRWYDVDIIYEGAIPKGTISGEAQRSLSFSQMQKVLQLTDVHFKIEKKKLIVTQ
jgi:hypothetical protein